MGSATQQTPPDATTTGSPDITVFRGWDDPGKYVWSPYVTKLEARLRFSGVRYGAAAGSVRSAPKGKIPYIECTAPSSGASRAGAQKTVLSDSALIAKTLADWGVIPDLNAALKPEDRTKDLALRALLEDKLHFYNAWERWTQNYYTMRDHVLWSMPYPMRVVVGLIIYRNTTATLYGQGTGRFSAEEIAAFRREIWSGFHDLLLASKAGRGAADADGPFWVFGGEYPTEADCALFGAIVSVLVCTAAPDSRKLVVEFPVLREYAGRIHDKYFPDYEKWA